MMGKQPPPLPPAQPHFPAGQFVLFIVALLLLIVVIGQIEQMTAQPGQHSSSAEPAAANSTAPNDPLIKATNNQASGPTRPNERHAQTEGIGSRATSTFADQKECPVRRTM
jgi:predicted lipid-binding transport protein (Tim44 family)